MQHSRTIALQYTLKDVSITNANSGEPVRQRGCWGTVTPLALCLLFGTTFYCRVDFHAFHLTAGVFILALLSGLIWPGAVWLAHNERYRHKA
jgi:hypothetical protein